MLCLLPPAIKVMVGMGETAEMAGPTTLMVRSLPVFVTIAIRRAIRLISVGKRIRADKMEKVITIATRLVATTFAKLSVGTAGNLGILRNSAGTKIAMHIRDPRIGPSDLVVAINRCHKHL